MATKESANKSFDNDIYEQGELGGLTSETIAKELEDELKYDFADDTAPNSASPEEDSNGNCTEHPEENLYEGAVSFEEKSYAEPIASDDYSVELTGADEDVSSSLPDEKNTANSDTHSAEAAYDTEEGINYDIFGDSDVLDLSQGGVSEPATETVFVAEEPDEMTVSAPDESQATFEAEFPEAFPTDGLSEENTDGEVDTTEIDLDGDGYECEYENEEPRRHPINGIFDFLELFVFSLVAVLVFTTFFFRHSVVEGDSMVDTLHEGEHLIISDLFYSPKRGDIIVCEDYSTTLRKPIVKRVIATEGERVQVLMSGEVLVNGELLSEDYVYIDGPLPITPVDTIVPEGEVFVMGDHRNMSTDSRMFGTVDEDSIIGKVLLRFYPFDKFGKVR